jgi:hypothetical protein
MWAYDHAYELLLCIAMLLVALDIYACEMATFCENAKLILSCK